MLKTRFAKMALTVGVVAACSVGLFACSGSGNAAGGTAATVNGTDISEQSVTDQIEQVREQAGLTSEDAWGQYLVQVGMTPEDVRSQIIDSLIGQQLLVEGASELGIVVEDSEVDEYVASMKANYDGDEAWEAALEQAGFTEDSYRDVIEKSLYTQKVGEYFESKVELTDEDRIEAAKNYASYFNGSKRSSHILFGVADTSDEEKMQEARDAAEELLGYIRDGQVDFADAAREYSSDTSSAENGGDVGWDTLNSFVSEYADAVSDLELGEISEPVETDYGVHLIMVTDVFDTPEDITSMDQIPEEFRSQLEDAATTTKANDEYTAWIDGLKENADIVINDMPANVPYNIDMTPYQEAAESEADSADDATEDATDVAEDAEDIAEDTADVDEGETESVEEGVAVEGDATESPEVDSANATAGAGATSDKAA